jgi:branched-chain amino acid transport system substrate-binding protein
VRSRVVTTGVALAAVGALVLTACSSSKKGSNKSGGLGGNNGTTKTYKLGFIGALSGPNAQLGINERQGAQLAIDTYNASSGAKFKIQLVTSDSEGDPKKAPTAATTLASDPTVLGIIGPAFSGESLAVVGDKFCGASPPLPTITASASNATLQDQGWKCWHRVMPNDNVEGAQGADWLARTGSKKVYVIDDLSAYGKGVADTVRSVLKSKGVAVVSKGVDGTTTTNYGPVAQSVVGSGADTLFYGGYDAQSALLAKSLVAAGFKGRTVTGNGGKSSVFTTNAGSAGNGWYFTCGCQDATIAPAAKEFAAAYKTKFGEDPSTYSPEAYDVANLYIDAISKITGTVDRTSILAAVNAEDYQGITAKISFEPNGENKATNLIVNLFQEKNGAIVGLGDINTQN